MKWLDALGVSESYQVPDAMMKALMDGTKRHELFSLYLSEFSLDDDPVNVLFQEEHGDRDKFKQDYTPPELACLVAEMASKVSAQASTSNSLSRNSLCGRFWQLSTTRPVDRSS